MRDRFGAHITPGCAGENILVQAEGRFTFEDLSGGLVLLTASGQELARLEVLQVAHPCRPFSGWALGTMVESDVLKETLQFLDGGTRGFYCTGVGSGIVSVGDRLALL
jgi:MOSC domain-containing protein